MVIVTDAKLEIGKIITTPELTLNADKNETYYNVPIYIIREATYEEYVADFKFETQIASKDELANNGFKYFYEVSTD